MTETAYGHIIEIGFNNNKLNSYYGYLTVHKFNRINNDLLENIRFETFADCSDPNKRIITDTLELTYKQI